MGTGVTIVGHQRRLTLVFLGASGFAAAVGLPISLIAYMVVGPHRDLGVAGLAVLVVPALAGAARGAQISVSIDGDRCVVRNTWRTYRFSAAELQAIDPEKPPFWHARHDWLRFTLRSPDHSTIRSQAVGARDLPHVLECLRDASGWTPGK